MAGRVSKRGAGRNARQDFFTIVEKCDVFLDQRKASPRTNCKSRARFADRVDRLGIDPIIPLGLADHIGRVWKCGIFKIIQQPPKVIRVGMGKHHVRDIIRINVNGRQSILKPSGTRHKFGARTHINKYDAFTIADQRDVTIRRPLFA